MKMDFVTFMVKDVQPSVEHWERVYGFKTVRRFNPMPGQEIAFLQGESGFMVEFISGGQSPRFQATGLSVGFHTDDVNALGAALKERGAEIIYGPAFLPNGVGMLRSRDPNGIELNFVQDQGH